jgi:hypothetical protein
MKHDSKIQKDYWPTGFVFLNNYLVYPFDFCLLSVKDMLAAAIPQLLIYFFANLISTILYPIFLGLYEQRVSRISFIFYFSRSSHKSPKSSPVFH